jgi:multidrug resistance efflux pump
MEEIMDKERIELRSEEVQEVMGQIPPWILRWGITVIFIILAGFVAGSYFFRYPDTLTAQVIITTSSPPVELYARSTGRLDMVAVTNRQTVKAGDVIAVINNTASYNEVETLEALFSAWKSGQLNVVALRKELNRRTWHLGDLQSTYSTFNKALNDYIIYRKANYYPRKIMLKARQEHKQHEMDNHQRREMELNSKQAGISSRIYQRDSLLYAKKINTSEEYDKAQQSFLQSRQTMMNDAGTRKQMEIQQLQNQESLLDLRQQYLETHEQCILALSSAADQLAAAIKGYEQTYIIRTPIAGMVNMIGVWCRNQNVSAGDLIVIVIPQHKSPSVGIAKLPATGAGKVRIGQMVNVRVNNFPEEEFGFIVGRVTGISEVPDKESNYFINIGFPKGLQTNYGKRLPPSKQMVGSAQVIIRDKRLIEKFIQPLEKIFKEGANS